MQDTVRTTIRIRKDLLDQSKFIALKQGTSLQQVINDSLTQGFQRISPAKSRREVMETIDQLRKDMLNKYGSVETGELIDEAKEGLQSRSDKLLQDRENI